MNRTRAQKGFTLVEVMIAAAVLIVGLTALTTLVVYSSKLRGVASKKAFAARFANDQLAQLTSLGYDGLNALVASPPAPTTQPDWQGRNYLVTTSLNNDCNAALINGTDHTSFNGDTLPPGNCCIFAEIAVQYTIDGAANTVYASSFVTKACP